MLPMPARMMPARTEPSAQLRARAASKQRFSAWLSPPKAFLDKGENTTVRRLFHAPRRHLHIGGVSPSRPTLTRLVSNEPSGSFFTKAIPLAPAFRSDLSAGT